MLTRVAETPANQALGCGIEVQRLVKRFGAVTAVDNVSLGVSAGDFLALLGPSGSGKTTLLMAIAGFELPDAGRILVGDRDISRLPPYRRDLGMVFQRYTLFPHMSVLENVAFPLKMRGIGKPEREQRARTALETVRLQRYGDRRPAQLSGGQQQRVAIARAIVYRPPVLLMDEPFSALDKSLREEMQMETKHLQREIGITVVFVTHDQTEALTMADKIAVLDQGCLQQIGSPRDLYEAPKTAFVAGFIGETNFCPAMLGTSVGVGECLLAKLDDGTEVGAIAASALPVGPIEIAVRPERLRVVAAGAGGIPARVVEVIYAGNASTVVLEAVRGNRLRLRMMAGREAASLRLGEVVSVQWGVDDAHAFGGAA